jgi:FtsZ-binding cell division protein ZapB
MFLEQEIKELKNKEKILKQAAQSINVQEKDLPRVVKRFLDELKKFEDDIKNYKN